MKNKQKRIHYVYKITNLNPTDSKLYYIGVRSTTKQSAELDTNYRSSSKYLKEAIKEIGHNNFKKEVLSQWATRKSANLEEIRLHRQFDVARNPIFYNKCIATSEKFDVSGMVTVLDENNERHFVTVEDAKSTKYHSIHLDKVNVVDNTTGVKKRVSKEEYKKNKNKYTHRVSGTVTAVDSETGITTQVTKEVFDSNPNLHGTAKGFVNVIDLRTGERMKVTKIIYDGNTHIYQTCFKGSMIALDIRDNKFKQVTKEDYHKYDYYKHQSSKVIVIYDIDDNERYRAYGGFKKMCKENKLPFNAFSVSCQKGGEPIYSDVGSNLWKLEKSGYIKYQMWYAKEI